MPALIPTATNGTPHAPPNGSAPAAAPPASKAGSTSSMSKNQLRRMKLKARKQEQKARGGAGAGTDTETEAETDAGMSESDAESTIAPSSELDAYAAPDLADPAYAAFAGILQKFQQPAEEAEAEVDDGPQKAQVIYSDGEDDDEEEGEQARAAYDQMSKKKLKKLSRLSVAELKQLVAKPEVVEWYDCSARDPRLLVSMKSYRNTVPVPIHWSAKREYLAGKRGIEKPPFQLPPWIADTGIADQRDAIKEKESNMTLKQKTRERVQPKMGKIDIDYQKLHDAFFKFQAKPSMSRFGEAYYEGKELETDLRMKKPGELSEELKEALSIPPLAPPPWLIAMQRFGPPPSYPNMRIRGLNAPIPEGAQWGFHPGGWGRPPLDEYSRPLYGDPFGVLGNPEDEHAEDIQRELWGQLEPEEEESEEEEEEEEEEDILDSGHEPAEGMQTPSGMATPSGIHSVISTVPGGLETPDFMELRKSTRPTASEVESSVTAPAGPPRELYQVVPERQASARGFMGSSTAYDVSAVSAPGAGGPRVLGQEDRGNKRKAAADMSINPEDLESMSQAELQERYDASRTSTGRVHVPGADVDRSQFADVIEEQSSKRSKTADKDRDRRREREKEKFKF